MFNSPLLGVGKIQTLDGRAKVAKMLLVVNRLNQRPQMESVACYEPLVSQSQESRGTAQTVEFNFHNMKGSLALAGGQPSG
jgi:hypothetical protein